MELNKIKEIEKTIDRKSLVYRTNEYVYINFFSNNKHFW